MPNAIGIGTLTRGEWELACDILDAIKYLTAVFHEYVVHGNLLWERCDAQHMYEKLESIQEWVRIIDLEINLVDMSIVERRFYTDYEAHENRHKISSWAPSFLHVS